MRDSFNGRTLDFQSKDNSSILLSRSKFNNDLKVYMSLKLSRGPTLDIEKCVEMSGGNRFDLVIMAAQRCKELAREHRNAERGYQLNAPVTALLEFQEGKIGREYIRKVR